MTQVCWTTLTKGMRRAALAAALVGMIVPLEAMANGYTEGKVVTNPGGYRPDKTPSYGTSSRYTGGGSSGGGRHTYVARYTNGGSGYGFLSGWRRGEDNSTGYRGSSTPIYTPHRSDWNQKLRAQRKWDEEQYKKFNQADRNNVRCGLSNAPAYCYRLMGPYPKELYVVRY